MTDLVLGDDHTLFSDALVTVLTQDGFTVRAVADRCSRVVEVVGYTQPDVVLLDRHFGDGDGIDAIGEILARCPRTKVTMLTADHDPGGLQRAMESGAAGYIQKTCGVRVLTAAIRRIAAGEIVIKVTDRPGPRRSGAGADAQRLAAHLTARERECLALLVEGLSTTAMTQQLGVSRTTVRTHVQALLTKLGAHSRLEAASLAVRHSLLEPIPLPRPARLAEFASVRGNNC